MAITPTVQIRMKKETLSESKELNAIDIVMIGSLTPLIPEPVVMFGVTFENEKKKNQAVINVASRTLAKVFVLPDFILLQV